jgi:hypothetical protein
MNNDIKNGASQLAKGLKAEAIEFKGKALETFDKVKNNFDKNNDGKVEFKEAGESAAEEAKKALDKVAKLFEDDSVPAKTKAELKSAVDNLQSKVSPTIDDIDKGITDFVNKTEKELTPTIDNIDKGITDFVKGINVEEIVEDTKKDLKTIPDEIKDTFEEVKKIVGSAKTDTFKKEAEDLKEEVKAEVAEKTEEVKEEILDKKEEFEEKAEALADEVKEAVEEKAEEVESLKDEVLE